MTVNTTLHVYDVALTDEEANALDQAYEILESILKTMNHYQCDEFTTYGGSTYFDNDIDSAMNILNALSDIDRIMNSD